ncbi:hypothetical protein D9611_006890 [Ephemerocybe angulata]|uniref:Secreted protein n=1 Tax=Ephemerocybe angulata TaxID=980116 RepID=A0A8H5AZT6_9AGAR|nr:hypothetical protein D9611_006890 [Tulosesus angulatus]
MTTWTLQEQIIVALVLSTNLPAAPCIFSPGARTAWYVPSAWQKSTSHTHISSIYFYTFSRPDSSRVLGLITPSGPLEPDVVRPVVSRPVRTGTQLVSSLTSNRTSYILKKGVCSVAKQDQACHCPPFPTVIGKVLQLWSTPEKNAIPRPPNTSHQEQTFPQQNGT